MRRFEAARHSGLKTCSIVCLQMPESDEKPPIDLDKLEVLNDYVAIRESEKKDARY